MTPGELCASGQHPVGRLFEIWVFCLMKETPLHNLTMVNDQYEQNVVRIQDVFSR